MWHATPLTTWRTKGSKIWIFLFILFPIYLCPTSSLIKKKGQELKQNNWKYLRDLTRTRVTKISRISWVRHFPVNWFFTVEGNLFSFMARIRIPTVLRGHQYNYTETVPIGKENHHLFSTYSCERLNFPALAKIWSYSVTFVRERLQLLRWFFTWTTHLFSRKKIVFIEPQVIFAIPAKEQFAGACVILVVCQ